MSFDRPITPGPSAPPPGAGLLPAARPPCATLAHRPAGNPLSGSATFQSRVGARAVAPVATSECRATPCRRFATAAQRVSVMKTGGTAVVHGRRLQIAGTGGLKARDMTAWGGADAGSAAPGWLQEEWSRAVGPAHGGGLGCGMVSRLQRSVFSGNRGPGASPQAVESRAFSPSAKALPRRCGNPSPRPSPPQGAREKSFCIRVIRVIRGPLSVSQSTQHTKHRMEALCPIATSVRKSRRRSMTRW